MLKMKYDSLNLATFKCGNLEVHRRGKDNKEPRDNYSNYMFAIKTRDTNNQSKLNKKLCFFIVLPPSMNFEVSTLKGS